jgi:hypothetical protein
MTLHRPPIGGLFRVSAPRSAAAREAGPDAQAEARDAIRHFMSVLEKLDRQVASAAVTGAAVAARTARAPKQRAPRAESRP